MQGISFDGPLFFERNRVFRVYQGGKLFHRFFGDEDADGFFPEEWIASSVQALNQECRVPKEGVSRLANGGAYLDELLERFPTALVGRGSLNVLVKMLDSAVRLPVQVHPDKAFARLHLHSNYGKAESWLIVDTREDACIYCGLREGVTPAQFWQAVDAGKIEKNAVEPLLNRIPVHPGDVFFVPPRAIHALGPGCLVLEVQEPSDFTFQPEAWCGDYRMSIYEQSMGVDMTLVRDCFDFSWSGERAVRAIERLPKRLDSPPHVCAECLIGAEDTDCFAVNRYRLEGGAALTLPGAPAVYVVTKGAGVLRWAEEEGAVCKGSYFLLPAAAHGNCRLCASESMEVVECLGPAEK